MCLVSAEKEANINVSWTDMCRLTLKALIEIVLILRKAQAASI